MNAEQVGRMLHAIRVIADGLADAGRSGPRTAVSEAYRAGIVALRDELLSVLDVRQYITLDEVPADKQALVDAMVHFCGMLCAYSRTTAPGEHARCETCPMRATTVDRVQAQIDAATEGER